MSVQPVLAGRTLERLFTPGIRLGWTFRDRDAIVTPYSEPAPDPDLLHKQMTERVAVAQSSYARARRWVIKPSLVLGLLLLLLAGYENGPRRSAGAYVLLAAAVIVTGSGLGHTIRCWWRQTRTSAAICPSGQWHRRQHRGPTSSAAAWRAGRRCWPLSPAQFADAFAEAIHAGAPAGARSDRAVDVRVLEQLSAALGDWITPTRLAAATQAALGHPVPPGLLSSHEEALIGGDLFPRDYRQQISPNLVRLDAFLVDLARFTGYAAPVRPSAPAYYTCLALDGGARSARIELLTALAIGWLTVQVSASNATAPAVIIAGADEITRPHLERLASACERRGVPLTVLFRHLREDALAMLGGGTAAFMRLGHHAEAEQAASYIGRQHKCVLSQLTATWGGNQTFTRSDTQGYSDGDNSSRSRQEFHLGFGTRTRGTSTSRNWSASQSWADGASWSDAAATQRVYEYAVEPAVLQNLPDHALLLAVRRPAGPRLQAVECAPDIAALADVSSRPPAHPSMPAYTNAASLPSAAPHRWPASPGWQPRTTHLSQPPPPRGPRRPPGRHRAWKHQIGRGQQFMQRQVRASAVTARGEANDSISRIIALHATRSASPDVTRHAGKRWASKTRRSSTTGSPHWAVLRRGGSWSCLNPVTCAGDLPAQTPSGGVLRRSSRRRGGRPLQPSCIRAGHRLADTGRVANTVTP
jgi:hypothetical protein